MNSSEELKIPRKETFIWRKISGDCIELEHGTTHILNPIGGTIWELINERNTIADIIRIVIEKEPASVPDEEDLRQWIKSFLNDLEKKGLISYTPGIWDEE